MASGSTPILGLPVYDDLDDIDFNELNTANQQLDRLPATVCTSATRPNTNLFVGRLIFETDTKNLLFWDGDSWEYYSTTAKMPAPVRGYMINANQAVTATAWANLTINTPKTITVPAGKKLMVHLHYRCQVNGVAGTALSIRLAWTGATAGNIQDANYDSAALGVITSTAAGVRDGLSSSVMLNAGVTTFQPQGQRSNATNAVSIDSFAIQVTPIAWGDAFDPAST